VGNSKYLDIDDTELLELWVGGNRDAGGMLYIRHKHALLRMIYGLVQVSAEDAEDILHEGLMLVPTAKSSFEGRSSVRSFLTGFIRNAVRNRVRRAGA